jgi:hypothetical protein
LNDTARTGDYQAGGKEDSAVDAAPASPRMSKEMSTTGRQRLGDFEILRELGRGGMGVVYEARQMSLNRKVALKVLSGGLGLTPNAVPRFHREAEAAAKLHHTNIVPVYATGEEDGTHFYAMELIDGPSLDHVIRRLHAGASSAGPIPTTSVDAGGLSPDLVSKPVHTLKGRASPAQRPA